VKILFGAFFVELQLFATLCSAPSKLWYVGQVNNRWAKIKNVLST